MRGDSLLGALPLFVFYLNPLYSNERWIWAQTGIINSSVPRPSGGEMPILKAQKE
jgi:hypothetical protein